MAWKRVNIQQISILLLSEMLYNIAYVAPVLQQNLHVWIGIN